MPVDTWDPGQYERFKQERTAPFEDLLALVRPVPGGRVVDLGCGTGELTARLHAHSQAADTLGVDSSTAMLAQAEAFVTEGLRFEPGDLRSFAGDVDVVFANAALQWVPDHPALLAQLTASLRRGGQLAVQVPANHDHPSHTIAAEIGAEFGLDPGERFHSVLAPEEYATILDRLGFVEQHVRLQVYGVALPATDGVIEWVKGTRLTEIRSRLGDDAAYERFLARYRECLLEALGDPAGDQPYFYAFKRILLWAQRPPAHGEGR